MALERQIEAYEGLSIYKPEVIMFPTPEEVDRYAASFVAEHILLKPDSVLTLPTGGTPVEMYRILVDVHEKGLDMGGLTTANLDEYWPISKNHPESYYSVMKKNFFDFVNIPEAQRHIPNSEAENPDEEAVRYQRILDETGPADLAILGIGPGLTCHVGFNEHGSGLNSRTRRVQVDPATIIANARFFEDDPRNVPNEAITQGMGDILSSKKIMLLAKGFGKAPGIKRTLEGPIGSDAPASFLRLHPNAVFVIDQEAGSLLSTL